MTTKALGKYSFSTKLPLKARAAPAKWIEKLPTKFDLEKGKCKIWF
jgi:hypothetical protein